MKGRIKYIRSISILKDETEPGLLSVLVEGVADLFTQLQPILVPKNPDTVSEDGIYELDLRLDEGNKTLSDVELKVDMVIPLDNIPEWVKAIRVNAEENSDIELF